MKKYPKTDNVNAIGKTKSAVYAFFVKSPKKHVDEILTAVDNAKNNQEVIIYPKLTQTTKNRLKEMDVFILAALQVRLSKNV